MSLLNVIIDNTRTTQDCVEYLMTLQILAYTVVCSKCTANMVLSYRISLLDGWLLRLVSSYKI